MHFTENKPKSLLKIEQTFIDLKLPRSSRAAREFADDEAIEDNTWMSEDNDGKDDDDEEEDDRGSCLCSALVLIRSERYDIKEKKI